MPHFADIVKEKLTMFVFGAGAFLWGATILILFIQFVVFLKGGEWPKWVLFDLIYSVLPAPFLLWIASPQGWYGLQGCLSDPRKLASAGHVRFGVSLYGRSDPDRE